MKVFGAYSVILLIVLASCRSTRPIQTAISRIDTTTVTIKPLNNLLKEDSMAFIRKTYEEISRNRIGYSTFNAKVDVDYLDAEGKKYNVNAHIRMYKDSVIWLSITGPLGMEGLRGLITMDSVKLLDKQNKVYIGRSVSFLQEMTALPLDLYTLQDLIIGNPVYFDSVITAYSSNGNSISLQVIHHFFKHLLTVSGTDKLIRSSKLDDVDESRSRTCLLTYEEYENRKGVNFSTKRMINVAEKKKLDVKLDFRQYDFNETLSFPFNIPKNYDRN
jgi:hypothetical protein